MESEAKVTLVNHLEKIPDGDTVNWQAVYGEMDILTTQTRDELPHKLDIPYGNNLIDPKLRLDIYLPKEQPEACPVFFFLHGGGYTEGDRAHYGYVARTFAKAGIITVLPSYRLAPRYYYPVQPECVRQALAWVYHHIHSYGGNPERIFIGGHSAGGALAAFVAFNTDWFERFSLPPDLIKGCAPISAPYDLIKGGDRLRAFVPEPSRRKEASPFFNMENNPPITIISIGGLEYDQFERGAITRAFLEKLEGQGGRVKFLLLEDMNHADTVLTLGDKKSDLVKTILEMIREG